MPINDIRDFIFSKLFFPKVAIIDKPGIIISKTSSRYGRRESKKRMIWQFEDIFVNLQLRTIKHFGKENAAELWYKIGKDVGFRYILLAKVNKPPSLLLPSIIDYIFSAFRSIGMSAANRVDFDIGNQTLVLQGCQNIICRKTNLPSYIAGYTSAIMSFLFGRNIEARTYCSNCPNCCKIITDKNFEVEYIPNIKQLTNSVEYNSIYSEKEIKTKLDFKSFSYLLKFKKVYLDETRKFCINNRVIIPLEIGMSGIINAHYRNIRGEKILMESIMQEGYEICDALLENENHEMGKVDKILKILCSFGWGIPRFKKIENNIIIDLYNAPITRYGFLTEALFINSVLNYSFNSKFSIKCTAIDKNNVHLQFGLIGKTNIH